MAIPGRYPLSRRLLHWLIAAMVLVLIPVGITMAQRAAAGLFDELTNTLYAWHKGIGFLVLVLMVLRVGLLAVTRSPPIPDSISRPWRLAAATLHYTLYGLLLIAPVVGWAGVTAFPALGTVGGMELPGMPWVPRDQDLALQLFAIHKLLGLTILLLVAGHISAALTHLLIRRDGLFRRISLAPATAEDQEAGSH